ncbi:MAG TPA: hypothetical protein PLH07_07790 [Sulfurovum sp.]|nr:MAG: hypothetical protein B7Y63_06430 [Sulfurovum sp. 35-42-20]OYY56560.1 MAG: hypothetical protein B7Y52_03215 [Sulfurovum sp. 28-43-6]OYZ26252.1 MAG: hypothetical protein B7Y23_02160 [Sulfurovum sp. 16-42-52]OYZ48854.1 MAG: hypothetical protein B7Y13_06415 [Sulfurovum sp. 24-42-9]OZA46570.1 MAG: hypothetical protein B7X80_02395 [Sulfurovum sp. 17-42-90]OZA59310.1 MAG: hypothetical protein B7X69_08545 [Sulfurovum sp. 39-42-12]HQR74111.1 hypothetical protein [Sulfurovum sp.]
MFTVQVERECGCFRRSEIEKEKTFQNREDAISYSKAIAEIMNEDFCKKHHFTAKASAGNDFVIGVGEGSGGGCCGGGHCG